MMLLQTIVVFDIKNIFEIIANLHVPFQIPDKSPQIFSDIKRNVRSLLIYSL